ncbi:hypothetical protein J437_LFUL017363 [Ladona fulva]|uniref:Uncharacterized protein n=1 Tax=Ladona fulva TaxID=123851 RepID=A0A8K0KNQ3_LADFU|nr:hypothetical protein J437_LFUL017363 [Ladona fulva]
MKRLIFYIFLFFLVMEEMNQRKAISSCKDPPQIIPDGHGAVDLDKSFCLEDSIKKQLVEEQSDDLSSYDQFATDIKVRADGDIRHLDERVLQTAPERDAYYSTDSSAKSDGLSEKASLNKNMVIEKLEQSLDDVASLFREKLSPNKISMENPREALSGTISVLSGLVENLKEKVLTIKDSLQTDSLDFEKPFKAITKMEEILQNTSDKMQKITLDAFKEGKPLHSISNKVTSKLQAINKKLEEKWCQVKQHLSKQNLIWNWLDGQIFQNCNEDSRIKGEGIQNNQKGKEAPAEKAGEEFIHEGSEEKEKYKNSKSNRKIEGESNNVEYKGKQKTESIKLDKTKEKYRKKGWLNPYSFDNQPGKGGNAEVGKKREKIVSKNEKRDEKGDFRIGKNEGRHSKVNKSGEWMEAMFNHRAERRRDEKRSDWYFTRARSRTRIRESLPSRWYFRRGETKI